MDHDEAECRNLHAKIQFTIRGYSLSKGAIEFEAWFNTVFKVQSKTSEDFVFSRTNDDGEELLEVMQHNPYFSIDALECIFIAYQVEQTTISVAFESKVLRIIDSDLN
jgi:hypothetical protein